jgi:hypothetical protein
MTVHHRSHWIAVAVVASLALIAFEAAGQSTDASAMFEGRPALAGAQAGQGAQAGPPQGGIGLQGTEGAQMNLRPPQIVLESRTAAATCDGPTASAAQNPACLPQAFDAGMERRIARLGLDDTDVQRP